MIHEFGGSNIFNNTVINHFMVASFKREADFDASYEAPLESRSDEFLSVLCSGVQGDHQVLWTTDNTVVGNPDGVVNCDPRANTQVILSNYTAR